LGNNWGALIANSSRLQNLPPKDDDIDYSEVGPTFKASEAVKNIHELNLTTIINVLKKMVHYRVFIPFSMFMTDVLKRI